jgi:hypothetical protein
MPNYRAVANGNWSSLATWQDNSTGSYVASTQLPGVNDDVFANGFTVTINQNIAIASLRNTAASGISQNGAFSQSQNFTVVCPNVVAGGVNCITNTGAIDFVGNSIGGVGTNPNGISSNTASNVISTFTGTFTGGANGRGIRIIGGSAIVNGDSISSVSAQAGITFESGAGATFQQFGTAFRNGTRNTSNGTAYIENVTGELGDAGVTGSLATGTTVISNMTFGSDGTVPVTGFVKIKASGDSLILWPNDAGGTKAMSSISDYPTANHVRTGISFGFGTITGTLAVPPVGAVALGVPVDNTVGTAVIGGITEETLNAALAQVVEAIEAIPTVTPPTTTEISQAVWSKPTTEITTGIGARLKNAATVETTGSQIVGLS